MIQTPSTEVEGFEMRGGDYRSKGLFSYVSCEARVPANHPLRAIRAIVDEALGVMSADFDAMYSRIGRPSLPPEKLLRALLLQAFYTIRSWSRWIATCFSAGLSAWRWMR